MTKADYKKNPSSLGTKAIIAILFLITFPAPLNSQIYIPQGLNLKEYEWMDLRLPQWMIYNQKIEALQRAPYKNLKRKTIAVYHNSIMEHIFDYDRKGYLMKYVRRDSSNIWDSETYLFGNNGLFYKILVPGYDGQKGFYYHYEFDKYNRPVEIWTDLDEKATRIEYLNDYECIEYPGRKGDVIKRIKWNKEGIILYCNADNHEGESYTYKYDPKSRIASLIQFSNYDTTSIDTSFYNQNLKLLSKKVYYKDTNKTGKLELYSSNKEECVYGPDGHLSERYEYNAAGQLERKHIYKYNATPAYKEIIETTYSPLDNYVSKNTERYDNKKRLIWRCDRLEGDGKITEEYERNRYLDTLLIEEVVRDRSFYFHEKYKYDKYGNVIETISFDSTGRVTRRDHTFRKNEVIKDQLGRIISIKKYENSRLAGTYLYEYYDDEVKTDRNAENTHGISWYIIWGAAGIFCIIAFSFYLLNKKKLL